MTARTFPLLVVLTFGLLTAPVAAQTPSPVTVSPEVHADRRVTFRFLAPTAKEVAVAREGADRLPMTRDAQGVWSVTTGALDPDLYGYAFVADGVTLIDPLNPLLKPNLLATQNMVHVRGSSSGADALPWDSRDVPRGTVHRHFYSSRIGADHRDYYVYTPPGYDAAAARRYPVLYLLHGFSDDASGWTSVGQAHVIMDNLIADKKAQSMIVVMPLGYGAPEIVTRGFVRAPESWRRNVERFRDALLTEVLPVVERDYRVARGRGQRAIAGLSMGGAESLFVGLNAPDRFAWIGAFSSGGLGDAKDFPTLFPTLDAAANASLRLVYIACGVEDRLFAVNKDLRAFLTGRGVAHTDIDTSGAHTWMVWRRNLAAFVPMLFRSVGEGQARGPAPTSVGHAGACLQVPRGGRGEQGRQPAEAHIAGDARAVSFRRR